MKSLRPHNRKPCSARASGFSVLELVIVCAVILFLAAIATPSFLRVSYSIRLKSAATDLSGLMQEARMAAAKNNTIYTIPMGTNTACAYNVSTGACDPKLPQITFSSTIQLAGAAPTGGSQPTPYVLVGDSGSTNYTNGTTLGYSSRGLPCAYLAGTCATPSAGYFVFYLTDTVPNGTNWAAVVVTRSGRTKALTWNGASWN